MAIGCLSRLKSLLLHILLGVGGEEKEPRLTRISRLPAVEPPLLAPTCLASFISYLPDIQQQLCTEILHLRVGRRQKRKTEKTAFIPPSVCFPDCASEQDWSRERMDRRTDGGREARYRLWMTTSQLLRQVAQIQIHPHFISIRLCVHLIRLQSLQPQQPAAGF